MKKEYFVKLFLMVVLNWKEKLERKLKQKKNKKEYRSQNIIDLTLKDYIKGTKK